MTCTWIAGYYVHSGRTSGNKKRNTMRGLCHLFLSDCPPQLLPVIPVAKHLPDVSALSHSYWLASASAHWNVTPHNAKRPAYTDVSTIRCPYLLPCCKAYKCSVIAFGVLTLADGWAGEIHQSQHFCAGKCEAELLCKELSFGEKINLNKLLKKGNKIFSLF